jgi:N6-adenosine-specific RNA methylase IME4
VLPARGWQTRSVSEERLKLRKPFPKAEGYYDIVLADPPWTYYGDPDKMAAAGKHYDLMTPTELKALPVGDLMSKKSALFLWATSPRLDLAIDTLRDWGLHYRGVAYVWVKTRKDGTPIGAQGVMPTFTKPTVEFVLVGTTVKRGRPFPIHDLKQAQTVFVEETDAFDPQPVLAPRGEHSSKPSEVRRRIETLCGPRPRIELFARGEVPGWDVWGEEAVLSREQTTREAEAAAGSEE